MFQSSFLFTYIIINTEGGFINTKLVFSIGICFMSTYLFEIHGTVPDRR